MKILWAFEPFHQDQIRIQGMHNLLKQLVDHPSDMEIGFVVTRSEQELYLEIKIPLKERFSVYPRQIIKSILRKAKCTVEDKKIHVLDFETVSNRKAVDCLLSLAKHRDTDLIALYTHARHGLMRLALGSFAETAVHRSKISLLLMNPKTKSPSQIKQVLYSSDFSSASISDLKRVIKLCKHLDAGLTIFHQAQVIYKWSLDEGNPKIHDYRRKVDRMQERIEQKCLSAGLSTKVIVASEFSATTELILKTATEVKADLIVVSAKVGPAAALMGGSVTRKIIRESTKPVLVLK